MGHAIHKHMHGSSMKSAEKYDAKEAYNKDLSSKTRMHYLENDISDKKGMSRYSVEKGPHAAHGDAPHRSASPINNLNKGYGSEIGKPSVASAVDPAEAVMAGAKDTREGAGGMSRYQDKKSMSRKASPLNEYGGKKGDESKSKRDY